MQIVKIALMSSALIFSLGMGGCSSSDTTSAASNNGGTTTPPPDDGSGSTIGQSSEGIYLAESNETDKNGYEFYTHPVYIGSMLYTREYRAFGFGIDVGMKVVGYDLSRFTADSNLSDLLSETVYEQEGPNYTDAQFNQRYYDIAEVNGALYFSTLPKDVDTLSQSSYIKYDIASGNQVYHQKGTPLTGEQLDTTFDLARGWFLPFSDDNYMGIVEEAVVKVFHTINGDFYKDGNYDYLGLASTSGTQEYGQPPVGDNFTFFFADSKLYNVRFFSNDVDYGVRDFANDPGFKVHDILTDVNTNSAAKVYRSANRNGSVGALAPLVLDGIKLYCIATAEYDDSEGYTKRDLYLLEYDKSSVLQNISLLDEEKSGAFFDATHVYKYGNNLYFKHRQDNESKFCSYNLTTHSYNYKVDINNNWSFIDIPEVAYAITNSTVIIPEKVESATYATDYTYDLVFKVVDLANGSVIKTLHHKELMGLGGKLGARVSDAYSDGDAVYFIGSKWTDETQHNIIVKIDSPSNTIHFSRYRFDAHLTGVITNN